MNKQPCKRCGRLDQRLIRVHRPFPKVLRHPKFNVYCNYCGIVVSTEGGNFTDIGRLVLLAIPAALLDILAYLWSGSSVGVVISLIAALVQIALAFRLCLLLYRRKFKKTG
jgi:hypothetical protein